MFGTVALASFTGTVKGLRFRTQARFRRRSIPAPGARPDDSPGSFFSSARRPHCIMRVMLMRKPIFRKSFHVVILQLLLLLTMTGWSGDNCCPIPEDAAGQGCVAAGVCSSAAPAEEPSADGDDGASDRAIFCSCVSCAILFAHAPRPALEGPDSFGRVVSDSIDYPQAAFLSEIFRPPLA